VFEPLRSGCCSSLGTEKTTASPLITIIVQIRTKVVEKFSVLVNVGFRF
jgi:hypothetical protein